MAKQTPRKQKTPLQIVTRTNYLNLSIMIRTLKTVFGFSEEQLVTFTESYIALMQEVADGRCNVTTELKDTRDLTNINVKEFIDSVYVSSRHKLY